MAGKAIIKKIEARVLKFEKGKEEFYYTPLLRYRDSPAKRITLKSGFETLEALEKVLKTQRLCYEVWERSDHWLVIWR